MVKGKVSIDEYIAAHRLHRRRIATAMRWGLALLAAASVPLSFLVSPKWGVVLAGAAIGGLVGETIQSRLFLPLKLRRLYSQVRNRTDVTYAWDAEKLILDSPRGHVERPWRDFLKAREDGQVILLYHNDALFEILAKRWFDGRSDLDAFRSHVRFVK